MYILHSKFYALIMPMILCAVRRLTEDEQAGVSYLLNYWILHKAS